jgi:HlyD family type I secretion membrane fusion protein
MARTEAQRELSVVEPRISELRERAAAIEDRLSRTEIRAPVAGTINEIAVNTIGGVITPAEKLVTIVPAGAELRIEAQINPADIDQITIGQPTRLRFSAFNQRTTPELAGEIAFVSPATSIDPQSGMAHYVARVAASPDELARLGTDVLKPGMPLEIYIETESRTALSYIAKPLTDQFARALREE